MERMSKTNLREYKKENGEVIKLTEEEFARVVDVFKILLEQDQKLIKEALNGSKLELKPIPLSKIKDHVGKNIFVAIQVKEEIQSNFYDFYYKLESVKLENYNSKDQLLRIKTYSDLSAKIEPRGIFFQEES